jgi:Histidine kinase-, DNA gyrase B-, and HSP90-like ATPase
MKVRITPKTRVFLGMRNRRWTVSGAIAELIDNSFGRVRGNAETVEITWDTNKKLLSVMDDGRGMDNVARAFILGDSVGVGDDDIGYFGMGGSAAQLWLADRSTVHTVRDGEVASGTIDWRAVIESEGAFPLVDDGWSEATPVNTPAELLARGHGTLVQLHVSRTRRVYVENVKRDLARFYAAGLRKGRRIRWRSLGRGSVGDWIELQPWEPPTLSDVRDFTVLIKHEGQDLWASARIGYADDLAAKDSRVSVTYGYREIETTTDCYQGFSGVGVCGWIDLGTEWRPLLATEKDGINDGPARDALMEAVYSEIEGLLQDVENLHRDLVIEGVALSLEEMFDGVFEIDTPARRRRNKDPEPRPEPDEESESSSGSESLEQADGARSALSSAASIIRIDPASDSALGGLLTWADVHRKDGRAASVHVLLNQEHGTTQAAMIREPVNHMLLVSFVAHAIADKVVTLRDETLLEALMPGGAASLERGQEDTWRGTVVRALVDRVRVPA